MMDAAPYAEQLKAFVPADVEVKAEFFDFGNSIGFAIRCSGVGKNAVKLRCAAPYLPGADAPERAGAMLTEWLAERAA